MATGYMVSFACSTCGTEVQAEFSVRNDGTDFEVLSVDACEECGHDATDAEVEAAASKDVASITVFHRGGWKEEW